MPNSHFPLSSLSTRGTTCWSTLTAASWKSLILGHPSAWQVSTPAQRPSQVRPSPPYVNAENALRCALHLARPQKCQGGHCRQSGDTQFGRQEHLEFHFYQPSGFVLHWQQVSCATRLANQADCLSFISRCVCMVPFLPSTHTFIALYVTQASQELLGQRTNAESSPHTRGYFLAL